LAVIKNHLEIVKTLLKFKANPNAQSIELKQTPLHLAFQFGYYDICCILIASGSSIRIQDKDSNTPIHIAYQYRRQFSNKTFPDIQAITGYREVMQAKNNKGLTPAQLLDEDLKEVITKFAFEDAPLHSTIKEGKFHKDERKYNMRKRCYSTNSTVTRGFKSTGKKQGLECYTAIKLLGKGSFGEVYLVIEKRTNKLYAMKVFKKEKYLSQNILRYALAEKNIMAHMKHPFIVGLHAAFQTKRQLYLIMEYCPGGDLAFILKKEGCFHEDKARIYIAEVILAIEYLHERNVIFRDLKPENLVLDKEGHAKLTDFGLSKEGITDNTITKSFCGSLAYLAPEIISKIGHGKSIDWYLIGALLYEMLVGQPPYYSKNRQQLFYNITNGKLLLPRYLSSNAKDIITLVNLSSNGVVVE
jgi:serine/threonine protein kinase